MERSELLRKMAAKDDALVALRLDIEKLEDQQQNWKEKAIREQTVSSELEEENQILKQQMKALQTKNRTLTDEFNGLVDDFEDLKRLYDVASKEERERILLPKTKLNSER